VIPVREPARDDDGVDALQVGVGMPEDLGVAHTRRRQVRIDLIARTGEANDPELHDWIS
jgi:hypothetical protein